MNLQDDFEAAMRNDLPPPPRKPRAKPKAQPASFALPELPSLGDIALEALDAVIDNFRDPGYRVQFAAAVIAVVPLARMRLPFLPTLLAAVAAGKAARWAYVSVEDVRAATASDGEELNRIFKRLGTIADRLDADAAGDVRPG